MGCGASAQAKYAQAPKEKAAAACGRLQDGFRFIGLVSFVPFGGPQGTTSKRRRFKLKIIKTTHEADSANPSPRPWAEESRMAKPKPRQERGNRKAPKEAEQEPKTPAPANQTSPQVVANLGSFSA